MTNIAILTGRIARGPEARETRSGTSVTGITLVTDRPLRDKDGKTYRDENGYTAKESEFHRVTCFNGLARTVAQYCAKGQLVSVQGRIHYTQWEDQDGVTRYGTEILADKVDFLSRGNGSGDENDNKDAPGIE
jgi:single-strand DNA-binding protein